MRWLYLWIITQILYLSNLCTRASTDTGMKVRLQGVKAAMLPFRFLFSCFFVKLKKTNDLSKTLQKSSISVTRQIKRQHYQKADVMKSLNYFNAICSKKNQN